VGLLVVGARQHGEVEEVARQPAPRHATGVRHRDDVGEHGLHRERGPDLHPHARLGIAGVREAVRHARRDLDDVARAGDDLAQPDPEAHAALDDLEALGLDRVDVRDRHGAAGPQPQLEAEQLARGRRGGLDEREALAGHRVLERLAGGDHLGSWVVHPNSCGLSRRPRGLSMTQTRGVMLVRPDLPDEECFPPWTCAIPRRHTTRSAKRCTRCG
jgi:hypothetical protein